MKLEIRKRAKSAGPQCFIATAVYGNPYCREVQILRTVRDERLLNNLFGKLLIAVYYRLSPPVAEFIKERTVIKLLMKRLLDRLVNHLVD
ncbi:MAG: hypothetical protein GY852_10625 [bacterium]|nr:hypothetical protein [bacterium]